MSSKLSIHDKFPWLKTLADDKKIKRELEQIERRQIITSIDNASAALAYALKAGHRISELEPLILTNYTKTFVYTRDIVKADWPVAEPAMLSDPRYAYWYCRHYRGPWKEAEEVIRADKRYKFAWEYAKNVLRRGFWGCVKFRLFGR